VGELGSALSTDRGEKLRSAEQAAADAAAAAEKLAAITGKNAVKRDFFGRPVVASTTVGAREDEARNGHKRKVSEGEGRIWVTFHEGFSNAVRKPITMKELLDGM